VKPSEPTPHPSKAALHFARRYLETGQLEFNAEDNECLDDSWSFLRFVVEERCEVVELTGLWLRVSADHFVITVEDITPGSILHRSVNEPLWPVGPPRGITKPSRRRLDL